jgi:hypothetical protein
LTSSQGFGVSPDGFLAVTVRSDAMRCFVAALAVVAWQVHVDPVTEIAQIRTVTITPTAAEIDFMLI